MSDAPYHWHVMLGPSGRVAGWPIFATARGAASALEFYRPYALGGVTYVKTCRGGCAP